MFCLSWLLNVISEYALLTGYVSGNNSFPQPLTEVEEKEYLQRLKDGDPEAKGVLVERNLRLVAHIVKKYSFPGKEVDDLISIGTVGLIKAIDSFDMDKGTRLATYAARCIENEILMLIRNNKKIRSEVYLQDPIGLDKEGNEISLMDILSSDKDSILEVVENKIQVKKLYCILETCLQEREKIASILGISRSYVSRIEKRALKKLLKELNFGEG